MAGGRSRTMRLILAGDADGLSRTFKRAQARSKGFGASVKRASAVAAKALAAVTAAAGIFAASAVASFAEFDRGVREVGTLLGDIDDTGLKHLSDDIRDVSKQFGQEAPLVAKAFYDSISAGVANADTAADFAADAARFATAGATDISTGVDLLSSAINAYGLTAADASTVSDTLFATVRAGKTTVSELAENFSTVGPVAASAGVGLEEVMGWVAQLTLSGTPTAQAMTQVRSALAELMNPAKKLAKNFHEIAGETFPEFIAGGGTLQEALHLISAQADKSGKGMTEMTSRIEGAMALLGATGENADSFSATLASVADSAGATDTAFAVMADGLDFKLKQLKAGFEDFKLTVGAALVPVVTWALEKGPKIIAFLKEHADVLKPLAIGLGAVVVALAAAKIATLAWNAVLAVNPFVALTAALVAIGVLIYKFRDEILDFFSESKWAIPLAALIAGPFGAAAVAIYQHWDKIVGFVKNAAGAIKRFFTGGGDGAVDAARQHGEALADAVRAGYLDADERGAEIARRRRAVAHAETVAAANALSAELAVVTGDTADSAIANFKRLYDQAPALIGAAAREMDPHLQAMAAKTANTTDAMGGYWGGFATAYGNAAGQMKAASANRRAALLDDLAAELDSACAAAEGMDACQQRLRDDWNLYGGQMVESTAFFVGSWTEARATLAEQVAAAADAVESGGGRMVAAAEDTARGVAAAADQMALAISGSAGDIESAMGHAARVLGYDLDAVKAEFGGLPAVADAAAAESAEALQRLADALGLTVEQVQSHLAAIRGSARTPAATAAGAPKRTLPPNIGTTGGPAPFGLSRSNFESLSPYLQDLLRRDGDLRNLPTLAAGGIVRRPTVALVGEEGPEAVVPLDRIRGDRPDRAYPDTLTLNLRIDGERLGRWMIRRFNEALRRGELNVDSSLN